MTRCSDLSFNLLDQLNDPARLDALQSAALLDTPPEAVFDRAVRLATRVLGTPVGLLSLVDGQRQFFKAQVGLAEPYSTARGTPLSHSFCQYVVGTDEPLIVRDAREDPELQGNLAIPDLGVVAYLGVPVHDRDGNVLASFCAIDTEPRDWTELEREVLEDICVGVESEIALRAELKKRILAEEISKQSEQRLKLALRAGRLGTFDFAPRTGVTQWDKAMYQLWWIDADERDPYSIAQHRVHPSDRAADLAAREAALDPEGSGRHEAEFRIVHPDTGEIRWLHLDGRVTFDNGQPIRVVGTARNITDRKNAEMQNALLTQELNHRVKNLFAITGGIINLTARSSSTPTEMARALSGRVQALASAHELIQPAIIGRPDLAASTTLEKLVKTILWPHLDRNQTPRIEGVEVELKPRSASSLALVLHELVTNAVKYGALSVPDGRVEITWTIDHVDGNDELHLTWSETGMEQGGDQAATGFGSTLIRVTVEGQLLGTWKRSWTETGLVCSIVIPKAILRN